MRKWLVVVFASVILCLIVFISRPAEASSSSQAEADVIANITPPASSPADPFTEGEEMQYYLGAKNLGPDQALNLTMTVVLPAGTVYESLDILTPDCIATIPDVGQTGTVVIALPDLQSGDSIDAYLKITPTGPSRTIHFTAAVQSDTPDPDLTNNNQTVLSYYSAPDYIDSPPTVVSGYENIFGTATPASPCNNPSAVSFSDDMSDWFTDMIDRPLTYHLISIDDHSPDPVQGIDLTQQVDISGSVLTFIPTSIQSNRTFTLIIKAHNGVAMSDDFVSVIVSVGSVPPCQYPVIFDAAGGMPIPSSQSVASGCKITEPALMSRAGYTFNGWYSDANPDTPWDFESQTVTEAMTLHADWQPIQYPITYVLGSGGTNAIDNPLYYTIEDDEIVLLSPTRTGYRFDGWFDAETDGNQISIISLQAMTPITLYAHWTVLDESIPATGETSAARSVLPGYLLLSMAALAAIYMKFVRRKVIK